MGFLSSLDICASGMTAQWMRMDIASENITNANTTRTENGGPYRRKMVVFEPAEQENTFRKHMSREILRQKDGTGGVKVAEIVEDDRPGELVYDPTHPDANAEGYVEMPNVDTIKEMTDAMAATQAFSANVTAFNTLKAVVAKGLEIGR